MTTDPDQRQLAREAKAIVALAFRNGPIEDIHSGKRCPTCGSEPGYSRITDAEMKLIMKNAVDRVFHPALPQEQQAGTIRERDHTWRTLQYPMGRANGSETVRTATATLIFKWGKPQGAPPPVRKSPDN